MADQRQADFAKLLKHAMDVLKVGGGELARATGIDRTTISRYRLVTYESGPPRSMTKRILERGLGAPEGYLDGGMDVDLVAYRRGRRQEAARETPKPYGNPNAEGTLRVMLAGMQSQLEGLVQQIATVRRLVGDAPASAPASTERPVGSRVTPAAVAEVLDDEQHLDRMHARPAAPQTHRRRRTGRG